MVVCLGLESFKEKVIITSDAQKNATRITSLDALRGFTVALMILVNNPGDWGHIYPVLKHADWNGCTLADLVFPFFIFTMGVSFVISTQKRLESQPRNKIILHIFYRSIVLFFLGLFLNVLPDLDLSTIRILGVLQRLAIVYLVSSILYFYTTPRVLFLLLAFGLFGYYYIFTQINVPYLGYPTLEKEKNIAAYIDRLVLGQHTWKLSRTWDPEGILTTVGAIYSMLIGILLGRIFLIEKSQFKSIHNFRLAVVSSCGLICILIGLIFDNYFPINKNLWSSSYVLFTAGLAMLFFGIAYYFMEVKNIKYIGRFFEIYGTNSLFVFFFSALIAKTFNIVEVGNMSLKKYLVNSYLMPNFSIYNVSLLWAILHLLFWFLVLYIMYRKRIYIKL